MLEQTVVHLIRQHVDATTFQASLIHAPTMQELASVRRFWCFHHQVLLKGR